MVSDGLTNMNVLETLANLKNPGKVGAECKSVLWKYREAIWKVVKAMIFLGYSICLGPGYKQEQKRSIILTTNTMNPYTPL